MPTERMTIAAVKKLVFRVEGFRLEIKGNPRKEIDTILNQTKQSSGDMRVAAWIRGSFPNAEEGTISVDFFDGYSAGPKVMLRNVRASYPPEIIVLARKSESAEQAAVKIKAQLKAETKVVRQVKGALRKSEKKTVQKVNAAQQTGELNAALDALDKALRNQNVYHPTVKDFCEKTIKEGLQETQFVIEQILAFWSRAEKEKQRLLDGERATMAQMVKRSAAEKLRVS